MAYIQDPTMAGGWRYVHEAPIKKFIAQTDADGNPTGALVPTLSETPDGRPIATTPEQVAALMELEDAKPLTSMERMRQYQIESALRKAEHGIADDELRSAYELAGRLDPRVEGNELEVQRAEPVTMAEQLDRVNAARTLAATLGYVLRTDLTEQRVTNMLSGGFAEMRAVLVCHLLNGNGGVTYGPCSLMDVEVRLHTEQSQKTARDRQMAVMADYQARQRNEAAAQMSRTPEARIAQLERQLAAATGQTAPAESGWHEIPGVPGAWSRSELNDQPVEPTEVPW